MKHLFNISFFGGGELPFPPYTNESLAIRYPPHALAAPQLPDWGKITYKLLLRKNIYKIILL